MAGGRAPVARVLQGGAEPTRPGITRISFQKHQVFPYKSRRPREFSSKTISFYQHSKSAANVFFSKTSVFCDQKSPHQVCHKPPPIHLPELIFICRSSFSLAAGRIHWLEAGLTGWRSASLARPVWRRPALVFICCSVFPVMGDLRTRVGASPRGRWERTQEDTAGRISDREQCFPQPNHQATAYAQLQ